MFIALMNTKIGFFFLIWRFCLFHSFVRLWTGKRCASGNLANVGGLLAFYCSFFVCVYDCLVSSRVILLIFDGHCEWLYMRGQQHNSICMPLNTERMSGLWTQYARDENGNWISGYWVENKVRINKDMHSIDHVRVFVILSFRLLDLNHCLLFLS